MKPNGPMTGNVMHPYAVALPPSPISPFDRIAERPLMDIDPLFIQSQGSLQHTSSCDVDQLPYHAWNGHPTSLPAYDNLNSGWSQAGTVGAAGFAGNAPPSITCASHVQVPGAYSSAYALHSPAPSHTSFRMVNTCWMPPLGPPGNVCAGQQKSLAARIPQPREIARPASSPVPVTPGHPGATYETGALPKAATASFNTAHNISAAPPHRSPLQLTTFAGGLNSMPSAAGLLQDPVAPHEPVPGAATSGPPAAATPYIIPSPTSNDGIGEEEDPGAPADIRSGTTSPTLNNIPPSVKIDVVAEGSLESIRTGIPDEAAFVPNIFPLPTAYKHTDTATSPQHNITPPVIFNNGSAEVFEETRGTRGANLYEPDPPPPLDVPSPTGVPRALQAGRSGYSLGTWRPPPKTTSHPL
jgi:hypothetical protein